MSTLTAGGGVGADATAEAVGGGADEAATGGGADADAAAPTWADFGFAVCAAATKEYAARGSAKVKTIVSRRRMRSFPFFRANSPACFEGTRGPRNLRRAESMFVCVRFATAPGGSRFSPSKARAD